MTEIQEEIDRVLGDFDPNKRVREVWGSYAPNRLGPKFKLYTRHVDATNSVRNSTGRTGAVYFQWGDQWVLHEVWIEGKELYR